MKKISLYTMSASYFIAGANHFINPYMYVAIMPFWMPFPFELVYISGLFEMVFAVMLLYKKLRKTAAWLIILMLVAFLSVHIQMIFDNPIKFEIPLIALLLRIPIQFLLIWWSYSFTTTNKI